MRCRDVMGLVGYWRYHPPTHELLAAYVGFKAPMDLEADTISGKELAAALSLTPHRGRIVLRKVPGAKKYRDLIMEGAKALKEARERNGG